MEDRIERHIYQYIEGELRNYRTYKRLIEEYDKELLYSGAKSAMSGDTTGRYSQNLITNPTSFEAMKAITSDHRIQRAKDIVNQINDVLQELDNEDKQLIELRYFGGWLTDMGVSREMNMSLRTVARRKRRIFKKLELRMML